MSLRREGRLPSSQAVMLEGDTFRGDAGRGAVIAWLSRNFAYHASATSFINATSALASVACARQLIALSLPGEPLTSPRHMSPLRPRRRGRGFAVTLVSRDIYFTPGITAMSFCHYACRWRKMMISR